MTILRTAALDQWIGEFLAEHPAGTVVEIGTGLNTRFDRLPWTVFSGGCAGSVPWAATTECSGLGCFGQRFARGFLITLRLWRRGAGSSFGY